MSAKNNTLHTTSVALSRVHVIQLCLRFVIINNIYCKYAHSPIQHIICNRNLFTNFLPCSHLINPNNETCLVTCAVSLTCATWIMYTQIFPLIHPATRIQIILYHRIVLLVTKDFTNKITSDSIYPLILITNGRLNIVPLEIKYLNIQNNKFRLAITSSNG